MKKDTKETLENLDLVATSRKLLGAIIENTAVLERRRINPGELKEANTVLGYLNACVKATNARMSWMKMTNIKEKVNKIRDKSK